MFGFHGPTIYDEYRYGVEVMTTVLGSSFDGRLFKNIREKFGEAYALGGSDQPGIDAGFVFFYVLTKEETIETVKGMGEKLPMIISRYTTRGAMSYIQLEVNNAVSEALIRLYLTGKTKRSLHERDG